jgi:hypothetical protein
MAGSDLLSNVDKLDEILYTPTMFSAASPNWKENP